MATLKMPAWAKNKLIPADLDRVDLCAEGCNSAAFIKLVKSKKEGQDMDWTGIKKTLTAEHLAVINAEIAKAKMEGEAAGKEAGKAEAKAEMQPAMDAKDEEIENLKKKTADNADEAKSEKEKMAKALEGCDPVIRAMFEKMQANEKAAEQAALIAKEKAETDAAIIKAKEFANLATEEKEMVEVCKAINTMGEHADKIYAILKAADARNADTVIDGDGTVTPITKSVGSSAATQGAGSAIARFDSAVAEFQKANNVSVGDATVAVMKSKSDLYYAYLQEAQQQQ